MFTKKMIGALRKIALYSFPKFVDSPTGFDRRKGNFFKGRAENLEEILNAAEWALDNGFKQAIKE